MPKGRREEGFLPAASFRGPPLLMTAWQFFTETWTWTHLGHDEDQCRDNIRSTMAE